MKEVCNEKGLNAHDAMSVAMESLDAVPNGSSYGFVMTLVSPSWWGGDLPASGSGLFGVTASSSQINPDGTTGIFDQFTSSIYEAIKRLGATISNGVATLKEIITDKVTTKQLCIDDVCVTRDQLKNLLDLIHLVSEVNSLSS